MSLDEPQSQPLSAKKAESLRPYLGEQLLSNQTASLDLISRVARLVKDLQHLQARQVVLSPFLEIGAGSAARSLALVNHFGVSGIACDISLNSLRNALPAQELLGYAQLPARICCDIHHLPFLPNSFSFVFAYRTLHHFGDPRPVTAEIARVLAQDGHFYFNEEPLTSHLRQWLRGKRVLSDPPNLAQQIAYRLGIEKVFWDDGGPERQLGILEARYDRNLWLDALAPFDQRELVINNRLRLASDLEQPRWKAWLSGVVGGNITGLCRKTGGEALIDDPMARLVCLDCAYAPLTLPFDQDLVCPNCQRHYPLIEGVLRMLPLKMEQELGSFQDHLLG